jgi:acetyl-CoA C-acetyltransferase
MGHGELKDTMFLDGLEDAETGAAMGTFAQTTADAYQITREAMDAYAALLDARPCGHGQWRAGPQRSPPSTSAAAARRDDEQPSAPRSSAFPPCVRPSRRTAPSPRPTRAPFPTAPRPWCWPGDPSARLRAAGANRRSRNQRPASERVHPGADRAIDKLLDRLGWRADDVDLFEINEAFAMVTMLAISELGLDPSG